MKNFTVNQWFVVSNLVNMNILVKRTNLMLVSFPFNIIDFIDFTHDGFPIDTHYKFSSQNNGTSRSMWSYDHPLSVLRNAIQVGGKKVFDTKPNNLS